MFQTILFTLRIAGWAAAAALAAYAWSQRGRADVYSKVYQTPFFAAATLFVVQNTLLAWSDWWRNLEHGPEAFTLLTSAPQALLISVSVSSSLIVLRSARKSDRGGVE